jgi:hypothetical protein
LSPKRTRSRRASSTAQHDVPGAGGQRSQRLARQLAGQVGDLELFDRVDAAHGRAAHGSRRGHQGLRGDEGRGAHHLGVLRAAAAVARQSGSAAPAASKTSTWRDDASMRSRTSFWKPFITLSTMISAATPSAMPSIDTPLMKEMKAVAPPARPARV